MSEPKFDLQYNLSPLASSPAGRETEVRAAYVSTIVSLTLPSQRARVDGRVSG